MDEESPPPMAPYCPVTVRELESQPVRIADVLLIGPAMIWGSRYLKERSPAAAFFLFASGVATMVFNGKTYLAVENDRKAPGCKALGLARGQGPYRGYR